MEHITNWIAGGGVIALIGLMLKNNVEVEEKISRNYKRLDEVKEKVENDFTRKDVCAVVHKQIDAKLSEISADVKLLLNKK